MKTKKKNFKEVGVGFPRKFHAIKDHDKEKWASFALPLNPPSYNEARQKKGAKLCSQTPLSLGSYNAIKGWWQHIKEKKTFFFAAYGMATNLKF